MKQLGHGTEKHSVPETGSPHVASRDQLSVDNGAWLNMEHNVSAHIIPLNTCKQSLVSLHVTLDDFEHGCDLCRYCKNHPDQCPMHRDQKKELE
jgi:hypothetical protein